MNGAKEVVPECFLMAKVKSLAGHHGGKLNPQDELPDPDFWESHRANVKRG